MAALRNHFTDDVVNGFPFDYHRREFLLYTKSALARNASVVWEINTEYHWVRLVKISRPGEVLAEKEFKLPPRQGVPVR